MSNHRVNCALTPASAEQSRRVQHSGLFPEKARAELFGDHVENADAVAAANEVSLLGLVALASWLAPTFLEVNDLILWTQGAAKEVADFGLEIDASAFEREANAVNLVEFCVHSRPLASSHLELVKAFGAALTHFWGIALKEKFPDRRFVFAVVNDIPGEGGHPCFTFWQDRS